MTSRWRRAAPVPESKAPAAQGRWRVRARSVLSVERLGDAESEIVAPAPRRRVRGAAPGRALHVGVAQEGAVAEHAVGAVPLLVRRTIRWGIGAIHLEAVLDPLEDVAVHVVQPERVGRKRRDRRRAIDPRVPALGLAAKARSGAAKVAVVVI